MYLVRSRLRAIINNNKTTRMAEHSTQTSSSSEQNQSPILSAFLGSPRFFGGVLSRTISDEISVNTPTSILDSKQFSNHPFGYHEKRSLKSSPPPMEKKGIGLVLIHDGKDEEIKHSDEPTSKMVLFASNLKVQVPPFLTDNSPNSPGDFGIKTRNNNSQLLRSLSMNSSPRVVIKGKLDDHQEERLSVTEMEMSEEYTCVMTHGPNPKTTHIFDDTIVESCCGFGKLAAADQKMEECLQHNNNSTTVLTSLPLDFLGFCYTCKLKLDDGKDIYIFRGEKAFCSDECRFQEMVMEGNKATNNFKLHEDEDEEDCYHFLWSFETSVS